MTEKPKKDKTYIVYALIAMAFSVVAFFGLVFIRSEERRVRERVFCWV